MTNKLFIIDETEVGTRLDNYLASVYENISRTKIQNLIKSNENAALPYKFSCYCGLIL